MKEVRVRFAPSPTGALHIGGVRTALYNFLLARKHKGTMILRIEDTDQNRFVPGAEKYIVQSLAWAGIQIDEGVGVGGPHAPYRQSERKAIYMQYAQQLLQHNYAYYAFDTAEALDKAREADKTFQYNSATRSQLHNSLTLSKQEVEQKLLAGEPYVIRLKVPVAEEIKLTDLIRGEVVVNSSQIDDKVLMKSDGMPTYHLANVVDDHLMNISHVIRGEEWLPSAPLHVLLYRFLGWEDTMPRFAHLPLLLKPDGNGKLSKRDADRMGFPIFPLTWTDHEKGEVAIGYKEAGYLPEALINFLAFLGWNPGTEKEIFSIEELIEAFSLDRINKAGARFDIQKAQWFNQQYLKAKTDDELAAYLLHDLQRYNIACAPEKARKIAAAMKERITFPQDLWEQGQFFFHPPAQFDEQIIAKKWTDETVRMLTAFRDALKTLPEFTAENAKAALEQVAQQTGTKMGQVLQPLRLTMTGGAGGPDLMTTLEIIGKDEVISRLDYAFQHFKIKVA